MKEKPFTITSFAWRKNIADRLATAGEDFDSVEVILAKLSALAAFLDRNDLSSRRLTDCNWRINQHFVLSSDDLTPLGLSVIRKAYEKWQRRAKAPDDVSVLEKALSELRPEESSHAE